MKQENLRAVYLLLISGSTGDSGVLTVSLCLDVLRDLLLRGVVLGTRAVGIFDGDFRGEPGDAAPFLSCCKIRKLKHEIL